MLAIGGLIIDVALLPPLDLFIGNTIFWVETMQAEPTTRVVLVTVAYVCIAIGEVITLFTFVRGRKGRNELPPSKRMRKAIYAERLGVLAMLLGGGTIFFAPLLFVFVVMRALQTIATQPNGAPALMASGFSVGAYAAGPWVILTLGALIWLAASIERRRAGAGDPVVSAP